ncbi:MAG: hypothetical protein SVG88_13045 [Halobacteriales archaeon]|nr:hypothetical protein [Halobacteriales archaeon]
MAAVTSALSDLQAIVGSELRAVITYDRNDFEIVHLREDLTDGSFEAQFEQWHDHLLIYQLQFADTQAEFDTSLNMTMYCLDEMTVIHIPDAKYRGTLITMEPDANPGMVTLRGLCREFVH